MATIEETTPPVTAPVAPAVAAPAVTAPAVTAAPEAPVVPEAPSAPLDYSVLKLDDKALQNPDMPARVATYAKENSLSVEQAQKLLSAMSTEVQTYTEAKNTEWQTMTDNWANDVRADNELGGAKFDQVMSVAKKVITRFATPELVGQLDSTGFGNHPELVRLLFRIGQTMKEDTLVLPGANPAAAKRDISAILYDHPSSNTNS